MTRFLGNWEVETDVVLPQDIPFIRYDHPLGSYTVFLRNVPEVRNDLTYMSMQVVYDAPDLSQAKEFGSIVAKEFLDFLSLSTNLKVRLRRLFQIFNWEPGTTMREALYFSPHANHDDAPYAAIDKALLESVAILQRHELNPRLRRAIKWFASGIASQFPDDQFSFFWFVVELVAQLIKDLSPVPDRCPKCKGPLYCDACGATPLHRPYAKRAIEQLFDRYGPKDSGSLYRRAIEARNMLMHGEETSTIEATLDIEFAELVDDMGKLAWIAILNQFIPVLVGTQPSFLQTSRYVYMNLSGTAHVNVGFHPNFDNPDPASFPKIELTMITTPQAPVDGIAKTGGEDSAP